MDHSDELATALEMESERFKQCYRWLQENMPDTFFDEVKPKSVMLVAHALMGFQSMGCFSQIRLEHSAVVLHLDSADADVRVLERYRKYGIKHYRAYKSKNVLPFEGIEGRLRVAMIYFTEAVETTQVDLPSHLLEGLKQKVKERNPEITDEEFQKILSGINTRFLGSLQLERLVVALEMFFRAKTRDHCQYEVRYNEDWKEKDLPSMQIMLAWRNTPKYDMLYRLAKVIYRHGLVMSHVNATYIDPYSSKSILIMGIGINGAKGEAAWDTADIPDFLKELVTLKYFAGFPTIVKTFVDSGLVRGNLGNLLKTMLYHVHQILVNVDPWVYSLECVEECLCRHPELTVKVVEAFEYKFHPKQASFKDYQESCDEVLGLIRKLDTGHAANDTRRKNVLTQALHMVQYTLKTNFYRNNKSSFSFRLDPRYLDAAPFDRKERFPVLPFAIFYIKGMHYIGYHIRFRDLSRGGLRTVFPAKSEDMWVELNNVFTECYNLAYTQQQKNKDIPEGGAKGVIFLKPYERLQIESDILKYELKAGNVAEAEIEKKLASYVRAQKWNYLQATQRAYVNSLLTLVNCEPDGTLRAKHVVNYYEQPEYLYLGPDERMSDTVIHWIARHALHYKYKPGVAFISGKPQIGINHKQYGVTSLGVNVYLQEVLRQLGINPQKQPFTIKMSGGPDGDVAGNQMLNLLKYYPTTAKLLAVTDVSGTIYDPEGLHLEELAELFHATRPISYYPPQLLSEGGFLLDRATQKEVSKYAKQTLLWKREGGEIKQEWLLASDATRLFQTNVHQTVADVFIPAGGRPQTLHVDNLEEFLDPSGNPTSRAIVEGANLYLTPKARRALEEKGVLIIRDSSANKCGVICSSYEVLSSLMLSPEEFLENKEELVKQILTILEKRSYEEARLLLDTHNKTGAYLTDISEKISKRINTFTDHLLEYLETIEITKEMLPALIAYLPPLLREKEVGKLPDSHQKAVIACQIAGRMVYKNGLDWFPSIVDILPIVLQNPHVIGQ